MPNSIQRATARKPQLLTFTYYRGYDSTGAAYPDGPLAIMRGLTFEQGKREFEAHGHQGFVECDQTGAGYYGDDYPWITRDGRVVPSPLEQAEDTTRCTYCNGTGHIIPANYRGPGQECPECGGSGHVHGSRDLPSGPVRYTSICATCRGSGADPDFNHDDCEDCRGTGCDPLSDITNSLLCTSCQGTGRAQMSSHDIARLDCLRRSIIAVSEIESDLREQGFDRGGARYAAEILARARRALADHLAAELGGGV
ncbi:zinc finger domain-containing protein [Methylohalobius crimeensis]|uniref:zinc finger domain-containing protein n=1 Tax=Methylohalobius crimeensis TaxID=244365 RepID=UPI0003B57733|nr:zinc finger domain-containing protein [Methylohalobius crimeensis]